MDEKAITIAKAISEYYGIAMPEFKTPEECRSWIKSILGGRRRLCPNCQGKLSRKLVKGKLRYLCNCCKKTFALQSIIFKEDICRNSKT